MLIFFINCTNARTTPFSVIDIENTMNSAHLNSLKFMESSNVLSEMSLTELILIFI